MECMLTDEGRIVDTSIGYTILMGILYGANFAQHCYCSIKIEGIVNCIHLAAKNNKMELVEYMGMKECDQWEIFHEESEFIGEIVAIDAHYQLYSLYNFYVELTMVPENQKALRMNPLISGPRLDKYFVEDGRVSRENSLWR